jgi:NADH-quinone oxidoreductase subunit J
MHMVGEIASVISPAQLVGESACGPLAVVSAMLAQSTTAPVPASPGAGLSGVPLSPVVILALCAVAGIGTVMLLPSRRETPLRKIGAVILLSAALIFSALLVRWTAGTARGGMGVYFWIFSVLALGGAVRVITHTKPVYSALYFVLTVFASAGLFLLVNAEFMAAALILIYAGAILVTYVFVIMLAAEATGSGETGLNGSALAGVSEHDAVSREPVAACAVGFGLMAVLLFLIFDKYESASIAGGSAGVVADGSTQALGAFLFHSHVVSLELGGLILTIAMVGAIMIARKRVIVVEDESRLTEMKPEVVTFPATPVDDNPHSIPVVGTTNPRQKAYPED